MTSNRRRAVLGVAVGSVAALVASRTGAQARFPEKSVRMIVPAPPGSSPDALARLLARKLGDAWGQPVVVENLLGAGGIIGHDRGAKAPADGYTMLMGLNGPMSVSSSLNDKMPFDPMKDLAPVTLLMTGPNLLVVNPRVPAGTLEELIAFVKKNPGKLRYGYPGSGTSLHLAAELLNQMAGIRLDGVPYKSSAQMTVDVIAGHIDLIFHNVPVVLPHVRTGALRAIAITSPQRSPVAPEIPTVAESGLAGYEITSWQAMYVPAATPRAIVDRLNADLVRALGDPELRQWMAANAVLPGGGSPAELAAFQAAETAKWKSLISAANIKAD
jgi:tripartite-type tricarboxylate transporter receptor subunit TctC